MSIKSRGIEVHDGLVIMPAQGTWAVPLSTSEVGATLLQKVGITTAVTGTFTGVFFGVQTSVSGAQNIIAFSARATLNAGTLTGHVRGIHVQTEILGTSITTGPGRLDGILIEQSAPATATVYQVFGIFISNFMQVSPTDYVFIRCSENGGATLTACMTFTLGGGATPSDASFLIQVQGVAKTCWDKAGDKTGSAAGWFRVQVHGATKFIQLYD